MMFQRVTRLKHPFGDPVSVPADPSLGRHQQTERHCPKCKLVKITVHPPQGDGWREWRWGDANWQFADRVEPECVAETVLQRAAK